MDYPLDFVIPEKEVSTTVPEGVASEEAFYAAASSGKDPIADYQQSFTELTQTGKSELIDIAKAGWQKEQEDSMRFTVSEIINSPDIDFQVKKDVLTQYSLGGGISKDLKDKFVEKYASMSKGITISEQESQTAKASTVQKDLAVDKEESTKDNVIKGATELKDVAVALGYVGSDFVKAIPASIAGLYGYIATQDPALAQEISSDLIQKWKGESLPKNQQEYREYMEDKLSYLGYFGTKVRDFVYEYTGNTNLSVNASYVFDPINAIPVGLITKAGRTAVTAPVKYAYRGTKKLLGIKPGTPAAVATITNPAMAADLLVGGVLDETDTSAKALGVTRADIIKDSLIPLESNKVDPRLSPDISKKLISEVENMNKEAKKLLDEIKTNPSVQDPLLRISDQEVVAKTLDQLNPYFRNNLSNFNNLTSDIWEGVARFTKDENYSFHTNAEAFEAATKIHESLKGVPKTFTNQVFIRDLQEGTVTALEDFAKTVVNINDGPIKVNDTVTWVDQFGVKQTTRVMEVKTKGKNTLYRVAVADAKYGDKGAFVSKELIQTVVKDGVEVALKDLETTTASAPKKNLVVEWHYSRKYDELNRLLFGENAVSARVLGIDLSRIARSSATGWLFNHGTIKGWFSEISARLAPRMARQQAFFTKLLSDIASTKYPKEFNALIEEGMAKGKENFTLLEIEERFPNIGTKGWEALYETHYKSRRLMDIYHTYINYQKRNELYANKFTKGLYVGKDYIGPVNPNITFTLADQQKGKVPVKAWDYSTNTEVLLDIDFKKNARMDPITGIATQAAYDKSGKRIVSLSNKQEGDLPNLKFEYALVDDNISTLAYLPQEVVPKVKGYWPRQYKERFFIERYPTVLNINGVSTVDEKALSTYREVVAVAYTVPEKEALLKELRAKYKGEDFRIEPRTARENTYGTILSEYEVQGQQLRNSQHRGEKLAGLNREAYTIDPLDAAARQAQTLVRTGIMGIYDDAFKRAFTKDFQEFLENGEFPNRVEMISAGPSPSEAKFAKYQEAVTIFKEYAKNKSFETMTGSYIKGFLHNVADVLESFRVPKSLGVRYLAENAESLLILPRTLASLTSISLHPGRQWVVQLGPLMEYAGPLRAAPILANAFALRAALLGSVDIISKKGMFTKFMEDMGQKASIGLEKSDFEALVQAIKEEGLLESIDHNVMVSDIFNPLDRSLTESFAEKTLRKVVAPFKAVTKQATAKGFNAAESVNRLGMLLIAREKWLARNPGKDWNTPKARQEIFFDEWSMSGSMSRAGSFRYQTGFLANFFQFQAITHKLFMNVFQDNATRLTPKQRFNLGLSRFALWGSRHGLPAGEFIHDYVNSIEDDRLRQLLKQMEIGLVDRAVNGTLKLITGEKSDIDFGGNMGSYSENVFIYFDVYENAAKIWDGRPTTNPRLPVFSSWGNLGDVFNTFGDWYKTGNLTSDNYEQMLYEAAKVASGSNAIATTVLMKGTRDKATKLGQLKGFEYSVQEIYANALGLGTRRDAALYELQEESFSRPEEIKAVVEHLDKYIVSSLKDDPDNIEKRMSYISSYMTMIERDGFSEEELKQVFIGVINKEKKRASTDLKSSLIMKMLLQKFETSNETFIKYKNMLKDEFANDEQAQEVLKLIERRE